MSVLNNGINLLLAADAAAPSGYQISRSLRFNSGDTAYLNWTPASSASSSNKLTYSTWVKRTKLGSSLTEHFGLSAAVSGSSRDAIRFSGDSIDVYVNEAVSGNVTTSAVFRDTSAWYHIVVSIDTTKATPADRIIIYVNGVLQTVTGTQPSQNYNFTGFLVSGKEQNIGRNPQPAYYADSYLAEIYCIDGQALTPSSFTTTDSNGELQPIAYTGTYGTNGFKLNFSSNATTAALGTDTSGNGNTWTVNNFSVTAGSGNDSLVDTPTSYGTDTGVGNEVRGNYCTLNPLFSGTTLTNGNLDAEGPSNNWFIGRGTIAFPDSAKWYFEATITGPSGTTAYAISVATAAAANNVGDVTVATGIYGIVNNTGTTTTKFVNGTASTISTAAAWAQGDILMCAYDGATSKVWFGRNGTWYPPTNGGSAGNPGAGTNETMTASGTVFPAVHCYGTTADMAVNFGQRAFVYPAPSGFKALVDTNLPTPDTAIAKGSSAMDVVLYTGNGASRSVTGLNFTPGFLWIKNRNSASYNHHLTDAVRGVTQRLKSNTTGIELTTTDQVTAYNSNGFSLGADSAGPGDLEVNQNSGSYVAWAWTAGSGSPVANNSGSIISQVKANTSAGFSVVTYTGTGSAASIGHGLGVKPGFSIVKKRTGSVDGWYILHSILGATKYIALNSTAGAATYSGLWNNTEPTSTLFYLGNDFGSNQISVNYISYHWSPIVGYSNFGSYTGNGGSTNFVYTGFRPRWVLIKRYDTTAADGSWYLFDTARDPYNVGGAQLTADTADQEPAFYGYLDYVSNGFTITAGTTLNGSAKQYLFVAFAESPFQYARAR